MRIFFLSAVAVMVMGCGGKVADASADETTLPADAATCAFGEIGRMPGVPFGVASTGTSVFVVAAPVIGNAATNTEGTLYSVRGGGAEPINQSSGTNLVAFGDQVAYLRLETTAAGDLYASHLQSTDDNGSLAQIDIVNSDYVDMSSIAFDGKNKLAWYRWPTLLSAGQPRALPSIASTSAPALS